MSRRRKRTREERQLARSVAQQLAWFGETLREARRRGGLSVPHLAAKAHVSARNIAYGEAGANLSTRTLILLAWGTGMRLALVPGPARPIKVHDHPGPQPPGALLWRVLQSVCQRMGLRAEDLLPKGSWPRDPVVVLSQEEAALLVGGHRWKGAETEQHRALLEKLEAAAPRPRGRRRRKRAQR